MALGNQRTNGYGNNGNGVKRYDSTYYARTYFSNYKDNMRLNITYGSGMMKLTLATSQPSEGNAPRNWEDQISVSITGTKANLLLNALTDYEKAIEEGTITMTQSWGIVTGMSEIQTILMFHLNKISSGKALSICSIDASGAVLKKFTFNFPDDQDFYIAWANFDSMKSDKKFNNDLQYKMLKDAIEEFARNSNGAAGYTFWDLGRYEINSVKNTINAMAENMGIQARPQNNNYNRNSGGGFFSNNGGNVKPQGTSQHKSLDEIQQEYIDDDED